MLQDIKIKKRIPNIIAGLMLGFSAIYIAGSWWSYLLYALSALAFTLTDQVIRVFSMNTEPAHFYIKGPPVSIEVRDKNGKLISKSK